MAYRSSLLISFNFLSTIFIISSNSSCKLLFIFFCISIFFTSTKFSSLFQYIFLFSCNLFFKSKYFFCFLPSNDSFHFSSSVSPFPLNTACSCCNKVTAALIVSCFCIIPFSFSRINSVI